MLMKAFFKPAACTKVKKSKDMEKDCDAEQEYATTADKVLVRERMYPEVKLEGMPITSSPRRDDPLGLKVNDTSFPVPETPLMNEAPTGVTGAAVE